MSIFEAIMLVCFGAAWPFSIYRSYTSRQNAGKSFPFLLIVFLGYAAGITHKILYNNDFVTGLYIINAAMVVIDMTVYYRNKKLTAGL